LQLFELLTGAVPWAHPNKHDLFRLITAAKVGLPLPHLRRDWARPSHICAGTGTIANTAAAAAAVVE
jgi:hypothetical protein